MDTVLPCHGLCFGARWHRVPFPSVGPLLTHALTYERGNKFCANWQTGRAIFSQHVLMQSVCGSSDRLSRTRLAHTQGGELIDIT
jgi:hypothetical protein